MNKSILNGKKIIDKLFVLIILMGIGLRLISFGTLPVELNRDEAALLYNAFTIANFGVDEWNRPYPLIFESFGDYKLPGYIYLTAILLKVFSPSLMIVRLPSLLAGVGIIWLTYIMGKLYFKSSVWAKLATMIVALAPWAIFYSRMAWEANVGLFYLLLSIYFLLKPFSKLNWLGLTLSYLLAVLTYNAPFILAPGLVLFILLNKKFSFKEKGLKILPILIIFMGAMYLLLPLNSQKQSITIFSDPTIRSEQLKSYSLAKNIGERIISHHYIYWIRQATVRWFQSMSPSFLVGSGGGHPWHSPPGQAHIHASVYLTLLISLGVMVREMVKKKSELIPWLFLLMASLLPAVITVDAPHATRSLLFFWLIGLISVLALKLFPKAIIVFMGVLIIETTLYAQGYFSYMPRHMPSSWPTNLTNSLNEAFNNNGKQIIITNARESKVDLASQQLYIYALLVLKQNPATAEYFPKPPTRDAAGLVKIERIENISLINRLTTEPVDAVIIERQRNGTYEIRSN